MTTPRSLRIFERNLVIYRKVWRGSVMVSFVSPLLFLAAMGLGLGRLVQQRAGAVDGVPYIQFIAPALMVASAMQTAAVEVSWPILGRIMLERTYEAVMATPVAVDDIAVGEISWLCFRLTLTSTLFALVLSVLHVVPVSAAAIAIPIAVATGLAFGAPLLAYTARLRATSPLSAIQRFGITPLFLMSGTFFPLSKLPAFLQAIAWVFPLAHGVTLARHTAHATLGLFDLVHVAVVSAYIGVGVVLARFFLRRRMLV